RPYGPPAAAPPALTRSAALRRNPARTPHTGTLSIWTGAAAAERAPSSHGQAARQYLGSPAPGSASPPVHGPRPLAVRPMYAKTADGAYDYRRHKNGIKVWSANRSKLDYRTWDSYVPDLVRGVRNSAHGLLEALDSKR